jgi:hypothetical protein
MQNGARVAVVGRFVLRKPVGGYIGCYNECYGYGPIHLPAGSRSLARASAELYYFWTQGESFEESSPIFAICTLILPAVRFQKYVLRNPVRAGLVAAVQRSEGVRKVACSLFCSCHRLLFFTLMQALSNQYVLPTAISKIVSRPAGRHRFSMSILNRCRSPWTFDASPLISGEA